MRVLFLTHNAAGHGGTFQRAHGLARALARRGHEAALCAAARSPRRWPVRAVRGGVEILEPADILPGRVRRSGFSPFDIAARIGWVASRRFDLVHGFDHRPAVAIPARIGCRLRRVPHISDWADLWGPGGIADVRAGVAGALLGRLDGACERRLHASADAWTVACSALRERLLGMGAPAGRIVALPPGAPLDEIRPLPRDGSRARHGLPQGARIALHGGLAPYDGGLLAAAFARWASGDAAARLLVVGGEPPGLAGFAAAAGAADRIDRRPFAPFGAYAELLACADVVLVPYTNRGVNVARFPNRVGDALAAGRPVVTNRTGDLGALVAGEGIGVAAGETPEAMAAALSRLFEEPGRLADMGRRARALAEGRFSWDSLAGEVEGLYRLVLDGRARAGRWM